MDKLSFATIKEDPGDFEKVGFIRTTPEIVAANVSDASINAWRIDKGEILAREKAKDGGEHIKLRLSQQGYETDIVLSWKIEGKRLSDRAAVAIDRDALSPNLIQKLQTAVNARLER